jgi:hypothetical protein
MLVKYSVRDLLFRKAQTKKVLVVQDEKIAQSQKYAKEILNFKSQNIGMCHIVLPSTVHLNKVFQDCQYDFLFGEERELCFVCADEFRLDLYKRRTSYERLRQIGYFPKHEYVIAKKTTLSSLELTLSSLLYNIMKESNTNSLDIEYYEWQGGNEGVSSYSSEYDSNSGDYF